MSSEVSMCSAGTPARVCVDRPRIRSRLGFRTTDDRALRLLLFLRRNRQPEDRKLSLPRNIHPLRIFRTRQIQRLAKFAAIHFSVNSPSLLRASALLLE